MRASPFAELDTEASVKREALKVRVRHFAKDHPLKGLAVADDADDDVTTFPWDEDSDDQSGGASADS